MLGRGSLCPMFASVLLVPILVLCLPRRRLAGLITPACFRVLNSILRLRIVGSFPFLQQRKPAGFDSPSVRNRTSGAFLLWPDAEEKKQTSNPCYPLWSPIDAAVILLDHAWDGRVTERLPPWAGLPGFGVVVRLPGQLPRVWSPTQQHQRCHKADRALLLAGSPRYWDPYLIHCPSPYHRFSRRTTLLAWWMNPGVKGAGWLEEAVVTTSRAPSGWEERRSRKYTRRCCKTKEVKEVKKSTQGLVPLVLPHMVTLLMGLRTIFNIIISVRGNIGYPSFSKMLQSQDQNTT